MSAGMSTAVRNARLNAITTYAGNAALLQIYSGTKPSTGGAITTQTKLAEFTMGTPFADSASGGSLSLTLPADTVGLANGTAVWARVVKADGTTHVMDLTVGTSSADVILNTTSISTGVAISLASASFTDGNA